MRKMSQAKGPKSLVMCLINNLSKNFDILKLNLIAQRGLLPNLIKNSDISNTPAGSVKVVYQTT